MLVAKVAPYLFYGGSRVNIPVYLSTGYRDGVVSADFAFTLTGRDGKIYADGKMSGIDVSRGGVNEICRLAITLPQITDSERLTLAVSLVAGGKTLAVNEWNVWVYERKKRRCYGEFVSYERRRFGYRRYRLRARTARKGRKSLPCLPLGVDAARSRQNSIRAEVRIPRHAQPLQTRNLGQGNELRRTLRRKNA
ncbi:MAG: hypothetical protein ACLUSP_06015 [Christensenellales bacterium]